MIFYEHRKDLKLLFESLFSKFDFVRAVTSVFYLVLLFTQFYYLFNPIGFISSSVILRSIYKSFFLLHNLFFLNLLFSLYTFI